MRILSLLVCLLLLGAASAPQAVEQEVYRIQYTPSANGAHMVIGFQGYPRSPTIEVVNGRLGTVSIAGAQGHYHGAIAVRLDLCESRLVLDGQVVARQECLRFPFVVARR